MSRIDQTIFTVTGAPEPGTNRAGRPARTGARSGIPGRKPSPGQPDRAAESGKIRRSWFRCAPGHRVSAVLDIGDKRSRYQRSGDKERAGGRCDVRAEERQHRILALARSDGGVDVAKLAADLAVAPETVRRDLRLLEQHGLIRRTHGGAYPVETARFETTLAMRTTRRVPEKRRIAAAPVELLADAEPAFIAEGFWSRLIAGALSTDRPLTPVRAFPHAGSVPGYAP